MLQQKLAAAKEAAARNQQALRSYSWLEKTELSLKGEVKNTKVDMCKYGPDGKVQKTPVVEPEPPEKQRGLKGKIVAKKTGEMKEELEAAVALVQQYVPPSPDLMQVVMNAGTASISQAGPGAASLKFPGYVKKGDALTLTFDSTVKSLRQIEVNTWLDEPENAVNLKVTMQSMPGWDQLSRHHRVRAAEAAARGEDHEVELPEDRAMTNRFLDRRGLLLL